MEGHNMNTIPQTQARASTNQITNLFLWCGVIAGPVYTIIGLIQALTRPGFDLTRHPLSLLTNGDLGWIQVGNFYLTGLFLIISAAGIRRTIQTGVGAVWGPILLTVYGLTLFGAGTFKADPAMGFPPEMVSTSATMTSAGLLHFIFGGLGFFSMIAACLIYARRFATEHNPVWRNFSLITGSGFLLGFIGIASGAGNPVTVLGFWLGLLLSWAWLSLFSFKLMRQKERQGEIR
jgi:Protein of unknown function (DUF998)